MVNCRGACMSTTSKVMWNGPARKTRRSAALTARAGASTSFVPDHCASSRGSVTRCQTRSAGARMMSVGQTSMKRHSSAFGGFFPCPAFDTATSDSKPIGIVFQLVGLYLHVEKHFSGRHVQNVHV